MNYKIGDYITAEVPLNFNGEITNFIIKGRIEIIDEEGMITLDTGSIVHPNSSFITAHGDNITGIDVKRLKARAEAMAKHPAGKFGLYHSKSHLTIVRDE